MKKVTQLIFSFTLLLNLTGCFGGEETVTTNTKVFTDPHFTINYPENWVVKTRQNFSSDIPQETIVTFSASEPRDGYRTTISVINDIVPPGTTSLDYAKANINNAIQGVLEFEKIEERDLEISKKKTKLLIFKGKSDLNATTLKYIQTYIVQAERGYTITASDLLDIEDNDFKILEDLVTSFQFKEEEK